LVSIVVVVLIMSFLITSDNFAGKAIARGGSVETNTVSLTFVEVQNDPQVFETDVYVNVDQETRLISLDFTFPDNVEPVEVGGNFLQSDFNIVDNQNSALIIPNYDEPFVTNQVVTLGTLRFRINGPGSGVVSLSAQALDSDGRNFLVSSSDQVEVSFEDISCGNSEVEAGEQCDGDVQTTCVDQGFSAGTVRCTQDCQLDTSSCSNDGDGDGVADNVDNCVGLANSNQADSDNDGIGDVCDQAAVQVPVVEELVREEVVEDEVVQGNSQVTLRLVCPTTVKPNSNFNCDVVVGGSSSPVTFEFMVQLPNGVTSVGEPTPAGALSWNGIENKVVAFNFAGIADGTLATIPLRVGEVGGLVTLTQGLDGDSNTISVHGTQVVVKDVTVGDINGDERVNVADLQKVIDHIIGVDPISSDNVDAASTNCDMNINVVDIPPLIDVIVGREAEIVCE
jgi:hypothetical protein